MSEVRYGIIGLGVQGTKYFKQIQVKKLVPNATVTALCDIDESKTDTVCAEYGFTGACFTDYRALIDSGLVDAILVETPHYPHPEISAYGLTHGVHVLCDKPAGVYTEQVMALNEVARSSDKLFGMMFNQRTDCLYRKMREMIREGEIGEIKRACWIITDWFRTRAYYESSTWRATWRGEGGGVLINQCPHQLDLIGWVLGMTPRRVHAFCRFGQWHDIEVEDDVTAYMEYDNGATGVLITTTGEAGGTNRLEIVGDRGKLVAEGGVLTFTRLDQSTKDFCLAIPKDKKAPENETVTVELDGENLQHVGILRNFTNAVLGTEPLYVSGEEGIHSVELMNAMLLSTFTGSTVELPIDGARYKQELDRRIATSRKNK